MPISQWRKSRQGHDLLAWDSVFQRLSLPSFAPHFQLGPWKRTETMVRQAGPPGGAWSQARSSSGFPAHVPSGLLALTQPALDAMLGNSCFCLHFFFGLIAAICRQFFPVIVQMPPSHHLELLQA